VHIIQTSSYNGICSSITFGKIIQWLALQKVSNAERGIYKLSARKVKHHIARFFVVHVACNNLKSTAMDVFELYRCNNYKLQYAV